MLEKLKAIRAAIAAKFDQWFVPEWRRCLKLFSVQFQLVTAALLEVAQSTPIFPAEVRALIPEPYGHIAVGLWTVIGFLARFKSQQSAPPPPPPPSA